MVEVAPALDVELHGGERPGGELSPEAQPGPAARGKHKGQVLDARVVGDQHGRRHRSVAASWADHRCHQMLASDDGGLPGSVPGRRPRDGCLTLGEREASQIAWRHPAEQCREMDHPVDEPAPAEPTGRLQPRGGQPVLEELGEVNQAVTAKATPEEAEAFRGWLLAAGPRPRPTPARRAASWGFGGQQVSAGEQRMLQQVRAVLGMA
jgi:hypothetical protein